MKRKRGGNTDNAISKKRNKLLIGFVVAILILILIFLLVFFVFNSKIKLVKNGEVQYSPCAPGYANSISQYNITWFFDKCYLYGTFANGDYWVKTDDVTGFVNITRITPDFDGSYNGWEVNPLPDPDPIVKNSVKQDSQGFDIRAVGPEQGPPYRIGTHFNSSLVPSLPYISSNNESIVKVVSVLAIGICDPNNSSWNPAGACRQIIDSAAVLTVLTNIPPGNGSEVFRPPYVGDNKTFYYVKDLRTELALREF